MVNVDVVAGLWDFSSRQKHIIYIYWGIYPKVELTWPIFGNFSLFLAIFGHYPPNCWRRFYPLLSVDNNFSPHAFHTLFATRLARAFKSLILAPDFEDFESYFWSLN